MVVKSKRMCVVTFQKLMENGKSKKMASGYDAPVSAGIFSAVLHYA